ncbi:hypothetical protein [Campylobacter sp. RM16189]|uniref:hypothetical protein n=1 Tax=Campylobacter sp. RM16189 TaxID=1705726 RepID=UPI0020166ACD|nr:hypothetical protein [Campylobacter sp. RM16189]
MLFYLGFWLCFFGVYLLVLALLYFFQERLLFVPSKLDDGLNLNLTLNLKR